MSLEEAQVTSRSNSDGLQIVRFLQDYSLSATERMVMVEAFVHGWDRATAGSTGRAKAEKRMRFRHRIIFTIRDSEK